MRQLTVLLVLILLITSCSVPPTPQATIINPTNPLTSPIATLAPTSTPMPPSETPTPTDLPPTSTPTPVPPTETRTPRPTPTEPYFWEPEVQGSFVGGERAINYFLGVDVFFDGLTIWRRSYNQKVTYIGARPVEGEPKLWQLVFGFPREDGSVIYFMGLAFDKGTSECKIDPDGRFFRDAPISQVPDIPIGSIYRIVIRGIYGSGKDLSRQSRLTPICRQVIESLEPIEAWKGSVDGLFKTGEVGNLPVVVIDGQEVIDLSDIITISAMHEVPDS